MPWFFMRRRQWLTRVVWVQYFLDGIAGQGIIDGLSPSGSCITGNRPVSVGRRSPYKCLCRETRSRC
jgi:hypothetical protein